jgi:TolA-binding protein
MNSASRWVMGWLAFFAAVASLGAATPVEKKAFDAGSMSFRGGWWERSEREFGEFIQTYPKSDLVPEAILLQAEARIKQRNFSGAIELLNAHRALAGRLGDEYLFWQAEALFQSGDLRAAAETFSLLVSEFPTSPRVLEAVVNEAAARSKLDEWPRVAALLQDPQGPFDRLVKADPVAPAAVRGRLLLAEALLRSGNFAAAEAALPQVSAEKLGPRDAWDRDHLLVQIQLAAGRPQQALVTTTNLLSFGTNQPALTAEGVALQARIYEKLGQIDEAIAAWRANLVPPAPEERHQEASLKVGQLLLVQGRADDALQMLESYLSGGTNSTGADVALLTIGQIRLGKVAATSTSASTNAITPAATNDLSLALEAFDTLLTRFPKSPLVAKALMGKGWCLWLDGRTAESAGAFQAAEDALPPSYDRAVARFKLGDASYLQRDFSAALADYQAVAANKDGLAEVRSNLVEHALFQVLQSAREVGNGAAAQEAMTRLLGEFPEGPFAGPGLLAFGASSGAADPAARRVVLQGFLQSVPDSKLAPRVRLAVARTYEEERDWAKAGEVYAGWLSAYPDNPERGRAEYFDALVESRLGNETNALARFTDFLAAYPTNEFAPLATLWVADHFWREEDYVNAERNYQLLFKNYPASELRHEARLMAARSAVARQSPEDAVNYLTNLTSDVTCPAELQGQAMFAYGDTLMALPAANTNSPLSNYEEAIRVFSKLQQLFPDSQIALLAQGKVGSCYLQLGASDPRQYELAMQAFSKVLMAPLADVATRSEAEVGLGLALEKSGAAGPEQGRATLVQRALDHYLNVVYGTNLRTGEQASPFWVKRAGLEACRVAESLQAWEQLAKLCDTLSESLPPLRTLLEKKKARALEQAAKTSN